MHHNLDKVEFLVGSKEAYIKSRKIKTLYPFADDIVEFLSDLSKELLSDKMAKNYPDIVTFAFWIRKASILKYKEKYADDGIVFGRGQAFHIAPSNVPVNYAYSLAVGLLTGNKNIVRVSTKDFEQVNIINRAFNKVLEEHPNMKNYIYIVKYNHSKEITDTFSATTDVRIIWGGDLTIKEIKKSELPSRAREVLFADRYSMSVIDSDYYMNLDNKERLAQDFYNDTYMTDQNACTSPKVVIWIGERIEEAKELFWHNLYKIVKEKYEIQAVQAIDKLVNMCLYATKYQGKKEKRYDNKLVRIKILDLPEDADSIMQYKGNSGYFYEYDCKDIVEIEKLINDKCQTIGYCGKKDMFDDLIEYGVNGVDRIVPIGKTMDFDFVWDGYDLYGMLTRRIEVI